jgi:dGTPase
MEAKRPVFEENCPFRGAFQRDRDRVLRCRPFRRLAHKTQVFIANRGDHHRTRLTHTLEVSQIARELARCFRLNEDLAEAASLAHDLGHTPFGHAGERTLNELCEGGFEHQNHSLRIVDKLIDGRGLNLTFATRDAIVKHSKGSGPIFVEGPAAPSTFEGRLVRVADIIAYLAHDLDDALKAELVDPDKIPKDIVQVFGNRASSRIKAMIFDLMENSETDGEGLRLAFSRRMEEAMERLRGFLRDDVYTHQKLTAELEKGEAIVRRIYERLMEDDDLLGFLEMDQVETRSQAAVDFIAGMTDRYAIQFGEYLSTGQWVEGSLSGRLFPKMAI